MPGYLLDTNHFSAWERGNQTLLDRVAKKNPQHFIWLCPIVLGEIEFGLRSAPLKDKGKQKRCREFIDAQADHMFQPMAVETGRQYRLIMSRIFERYPKEALKDTTQKHLTSIKVDLNDAWFAAVALTHNLILVTDDDMAVIKGCVPELRMENWLA